MMEQISRHIRGRTQRYWKKMMEDWRDSDLSPTEFRQLHKIKKSVFFKWKVKLGYHGKEPLNSNKKTPHNLIKPEQSNSEISPFIKVNLLDNDISRNDGQEKTLPAQVEVLLKNGRHIKFPYPNNDLEFSRLINILEGTPC